MSIRPAAAADVISQGTWNTVVSLIGVLPDDALARTVAMTTAQVKQPTATAAAYDAAITLLLAAVEEQERRIDPSGDPARLRLVATGRVADLLSEVLASRDVR